jgi:hypothetical protein
MRVWILDSDIKSSVEIYSALSGAGLDAAIRRFPQDIDPVLGDVVLVNIDSVKSYKWFQFSLFWEITYTENQTEQRAYFHRPFSIDDLVDVVSFFKPSNVMRFPLFCSNCGKSVELSE